MNLEQGEVEATPGLNDDTTTTTADLPDNPQDDVDEEAGLVAGFNEARGVSEPAHESESDPDGKSASQATDATASATAETPEPSDDDDQTQTATDAPPAPAETDDSAKKPTAQTPPATNPLEGVPADQLRALVELAPEVQRLRKGLDSVAGQVGGINRLLKELQSVSASQPQGSPAAAAAQKIEANLLEHLSADYPELAEALAKDLSKVLATAAPSGATVDESKLEEIVGKRLAAATEDVHRRVRLELAQERVYEVHPNWEADIAAKDASGKPIMTPDGKYRASQEFLQWFGAKDDGFRREFESTDSPTFLIKALTEFKEYRAAAQKARAQKRQRLEAGVTPRGATVRAPEPHQLTEEEALEIGFRAVRGGR